MADFRMVSAGGQAPGPGEKIAHTAAPAEIERSNLQRLCGESGRVEVSGKDGGMTSLEPLRRLAQDEVDLGDGDRGIAHIPGLKIPGE